MLLFVDMSQIGGTAHLDPMYIWRPSGQQGTCSLALTDGQAYGKVLAALPLQSDVLVCVCVGA